jgi:glycosyltransferase 2 family protein
MKSTLWRQVWRWLPGVIISIIALIVLFRLVSWHELAQAFSSLSPLVILAGVVLTILSTLARTQTWRILLGERASFSQTFHILNIGFLLNNILPLRSGELGRAVLMGRSSRLGTFHVISTIVIERSYDLAIAATFILTTLPLALGIEWARPLAITVLGFVILGLFSLYLLARFNERVSQWITKIGARNPFLKRVVAPRIQSLLEGLQALTSARKMVESVFWILMTWILYVFVTALFLAAFVPNPPFWWAIYLNGAVALGVAVPAGPGNIGVYEASVVGALSILHVSASQALAFALAIHSMNWITMSLLGIMGLSQLGYTLADVSSKIGSSKKPLPENETDA